MRDACIGDGPACDDVRRAAILERMTAVPGPAPLPPPRPMNTVPPALPRPCTGGGCRDERGLCEGCYRTGAEIACWSQISDDERLRMMEEVLPAREAGQV